VWAAILLPLACGGSGLKVADVEKILRGRLPTGSSVQYVGAVLDSMNVEHSTCDASNGDILVIWRRTHRSLLSEQSIQARIEFDRTGRMLRYSVKELSTRT